MTGPTASRFEHPDWEHPGGEDAVRADTRDRMDGAKRWMIISLCWCVAGVVLSMIGVFGADIFTFAGFGCILVSLLMSLYSLLQSQRGERAHQAQMRAKIEALRTRVETEEAPGEQ